MINVFATGHGRWIPNDGFVRVPDKFRVHFYTHFAKALLTNTEYQILEAKRTEPESTYESLTMVPNMTLQYQDPEWTNLSKAKLNKAHWGPKSRVVSARGADETLKSTFELLADHPFFKDEECDIHWLACAVVALRPRGGCTIGWNSADRGFGEEAHRFYNTTQNRGPQRLWADLKR